MHHSRPSTTAKLMRQFTLLLCLMFAVAASAQNDLGLSLKTQALQQIQAGNNDSAAVVFQRWLQADPQDKESWYNLACTYALLGKTAESLRALENAVLAGWHDVETTNADADLQSIRSDSAYVGLIEKMKSNVPKSGPKGAIRHYVPATTVGTYIVALPDDYNTSTKTYPVCVILHGSGSSETGHGAMADWLGRDDVIYVAPRALHPHEEAIKARSGEMMGYTAWPQPDINSTDTLKNNPARDYAQLVRQCVIDAQQRYRTNSEVWLLGHRQGAAFAWITAVTFPTLPTRVFCFAGYYPEEYTSIYQCEEIGLSRIDLTVFHGKRDGVVNPQESQDLHTQLDKAGVRHRFTVLDETGHSISKDVADAMREWISAGIKHKR